MWIALFKYGAKYGALGSRGFGSIRYNLAERHQLGTRHEEHYRPSCYGLHHE
jgi:hypothetical protein